MRHCLKRLGDSWMRMKKRRKRLKFRRRPYTLSGGAFPDKFKFKFWSGGSWFNRPKIKTYLLTLSDQVRCSCRRVADPETTVACLTDDEPWHIAIKNINVPASEQGNPRETEDWPTVCECGYIFRPDDEFELIYRPLYLRSDTQELVTLAEAPAGAIWKEGESWILRTPGGDLNLDSRAGNCSKPWCNDHKCWIMHGEPPEITVDKQGNSCDAGGGSIIMGDWHGFLRNGWLE